MDDVKKIYSQLISKYFNYYYSVYYDFIIEAIKNTLKDLKNKELDIDTIHKHIKENYI